MTGAAGAWVLIFATFAHGSGNAGHILQTTDGANFAVPPGCSSPHITFLGPDHVSPSRSTLAVSLLHHRGRYWIVHEYNTLVAGSPDMCNATVGIMATSRDDPCDKYEFVAEVQAAPSGASREVWGPRWFQDDDGALYIIANVADGCENGNPIPNQRPHLVRALSEDLVAWGAPVPMSGGLPSLYDAFLLSPKQNPTEQYAMWYTSGNYVEYATSPAILGGYVVQRSGDWAGWVKSNMVSPRDPSCTGCGYAVEGEIPVKMPNGKWRVYLDVHGNERGGGYAYSEATGAGWESWTVPPAYVVSPGIVTGTGSFAIESGR